MSHENSSIRHAPFTKPYKIRKIGKLWVPFIWNPYCKKYIRSYRCNSFEGALQVIARAEIFKELIDDALA